MLQNMNTNKVQVQSAISHIPMDNHCDNNFDLACNKLLEKIAVKFPAVQNGRHRYRTVSSVQAYRGNNILNQISSRYNQGS